MKTLDRFRLWVARWVCPRGWGVIEGRPISRWVSIHDGRHYAIGIATENVRRGDVVELANQVTE